MNRVLLLLSFLAFFCAAHGCVGTPGRPITGTLELELLDLRAATSTGWSVEVERAGLLVSAVRVRDASMPAAIAALEALVSARAFAHGGHGEADSTVLASWVGAEIVVLGETPASLLLEGRAGITDRAALVLGGMLPSSDADLPLLHDQPLWVEGTATSGSSTVRFAGGFELPAAESERLVEGIALAGAIDDDTVVHFGIDLGVWFDSVHFDRLTPGPDGIAPIDGGTQAALAMRLGLGSLDGYVGSVETPAL
jgi:hypothetical protein